MPCRDPDLLVLVHDDHGIVIAGYHLRSVAAIPYLTLVFKESRCDPRRLIPSRVRGDFVSEKKPILHVLSHKEAGPLS